MAPARTHSRKISRSLSISIRTTFIFATWLAMLDIKEQSERRAVTESRTKTSAPDVATAESESGIHAVAPQTLKPFLAKSLARASRKRRFPATKKTDDLSFGMNSPSKDIQLGPCTYQTDITDR